jgi:hypothetical protein
MDDIQKAMRQRYSHIHPILFQRSLEHAKTNGELFDILETIPSQYPIVWDEESRKWIVTQDLLQSKNVKIDKEP